MLSFKFHPFSSQERPEIACLSVTVHRRRWKQQAHLSTFSLPAAKVTVIMANAAGLLNRKPYSAR
jgi:hypothetical protein